MKKLFTRSSRKTLKEKSKLLIHFLTKSIMHKPARPWGPIGPGAPLKYVYIKTYIIWLKILPLALDLPAFRSGPFVQVYLIEKYLLNYSSLLYLNILPGFPIGPMTPGSPLLK